MRRGGVVMGTVGTLLLAGALTATAGAGPDLKARQLDMRELRSEMTLNRKLAAYIVRNGCPDVAETRFLSDEPPWDEYQVTLSYLGMRKEISFARAVILGNPSIHLERAERPLSDQEASALQSRAKTYCVMKHGLRGAAADVYVLERQ